MSQHTRIILDTGTFWRSAVWDWLVARDEDLILPAVAFIERARQLNFAGRSVRDFQIYLHMYGVQIEALGAVEGLRLACSVEDDKLWKRSARDAFIGGHIKAGDELWTTNPKDFIELGVPERQIVAV